MERNSHARESEITQFLESTTMVGLFPVPHQLFVRKYQDNEDTQTWFRSFTWGLLITRNQHHGLVNFNSVKLFTLTVVN